MSMMKTRLAEVLYPTFSEFSSLSGLELRNVKQVFTEASLEQLVLEFNSKSLLITAREDDDSIDFDITNPSVAEHPGIDVSLSKPWKDLIGKPFGWVWITINQQGYCDGLLLSFGDTVAVPRLILNVVASSIKIGSIQGL